MKVWILESHHFQSLVHWTLQNLFKRNFFFQNDLVKTRKFYEFILVDIDSVEITHIQNKDSTDIFYSKCKIFKIIFRNPVGTVS